MSHYLNEAASEMRDLLMPTIEAPRLSSKQLLGLPDSTRGRIDGFVLPCLAV